jgi:hypothetical protein
MCCYQNTISNASNAKNAMDGWMDGDTIHFTLQDYVDDIITRM